MAEIPDLADERPQRYYFGEKWDAPMFDDAVQMPVPTGEPCLLCERPVADTDSGMFMLHYAEGADGVGYRPQHLPCLLRMALGSPAHLQGNCSCQGKVEPVDDRDWYDQGLEVMELIKTGNVWWNKVS